ncbi:MAG TPA: hypothetical protein VMW01_01935 [Williamwhitmania sp.]|nr:hypothetical protein [Williamwhitmania sp.]
MGNQTIIRIAAILLLFADGCGLGRRNDSHPNSNSVDNRLKSGIVVFSPIKILGVHVSSTLYFDDYGQKQLIETFNEGDDFGLSGRSHSINLIRDGYLYSFDLFREENGDDMTENMVLKRVLSTTLLAAYPQFLLSDSMKRFMDYREEGSEFLLGVLGTKFSYSLYHEYPQRRMHGVHFNNVVLKTEINGVEVVAQTFSKNPNIPDQQFDLPIGYNIQDYDSGEIDSNSPSGGEDING